LEKFLILLLNDVIKTDFGPGTKFFWWNQIVQ